MGNTLMRFMERIQAHPRLTRIWEETLLPELTGVHRFFHLKHRLNAAATNIHSQYIFEIGFLL